MKRYFYLLILILLISCSSSEEGEIIERESRQLDFTSTVEFVHSDGKIITEIEVAIADDDNSRSEGLMDVHDLPTNAGMLFIFEDEAERSFWMANTPLSLDIIYANAEYEIVRIHRNTPPYSNEQILSELPAKYVVETNAGFTMAQDITEGIFIRIGDN